MIGLLTRPGRRIGRAVAALAALAAVAVGAMPVLGHAPDPLIGWPAWNQNQVVRYRWMTGEVPPAAMQTAIRAGATDANESRSSRAPTFVYDSAGTSTVEYGTSVFCGVNGLACADAANAPRSFRVGFRNHGYRFDWGTLRWCQLLDPVTDGCYDVENIMLDELGHVGGVIAPGQDAAVNLRMERLYAPLQDLGEARQVRHATGLNAGILECAERVAGGEQLPTKRVEALSELHQTCLVPDA